MRVHSQIAIHVNLINEYLCVYILMELLISVPSQLSFGPQCLFYSIALMMGDSFGAFIFHFCDFHFHFPFVACKTLPA